MDSGIKLRTYFTAYAARVCGSLLFFAVIGLLIAFHETARAQQLDYTWTGLGADSQWTTAENWDPVGVPHPNLGDTQYTMAGTLRLDPMISQIYVINKITYDNTAGAFTITNSSAFWMGNGGFVNNSTSTQTVDATVNLFDSQTWNAAAGDMVFRDVEMLFGSGKLLTVDGANDVTVTGNITGQIGVTKQGTGTLLLSDTNTYANGTTVEAGILRAGSATALSQDTNYTVNGGTLDLNDFELIASQLDGTGGTIDIGNADLIVDQSSDTTFAGVITGPGTLWKAGTGNLTLTGPNNYSLDTIVFAGTLTGTTTSLQGAIDNDAEVVFDQETNGTYAGVILGTGAVTKEGSGTVSFTEISTYTGPTTVNAGTLAVNGIIMSDTTVGANGTLAGSGTISGDVVVNGTTAAGNSNGSLSVVGNYTSTSGSATEVEIGGAGTVPGGNVDLVAVTGAATIDGTVNVEAGPGSYMAGSQYTFLTASAINGSYASITDDLAFFTAELGYTGTSAYFTLVLNDDPFGSIAATPNQLAVGNYLDVISSGAIGELADLITSLYPQTIPEVQTVLQQMSGEIYGTTQQVGVQNTTLILHTLAQQLQPPSFQNGGTDEGWAMDDVVSELSTSEIVQISFQPDGAMQFRQNPGPSHNAWALGFGIGGDANSDGNATGLDYGMGGALVGMDTYLDRGHRLGLYGGYVGTGVNTNSGTARNDIDSGQIGTYYTGRSGNDYYTMIGGFQFDDYESQRTINGGGLNLVTEGDYDGWQGFSYLERGMVLYSCDRWSCQPFGALQYVHVRQNGFTETGGGGAALSVDGLDDDSLRSLLGVRTQVRTVSNRRNITPEFRAVWVHEFLDTNSPVVARFAAVGGSAFIADGLNMGRDWALVGTGLNCNLGRGWSTQANYDAQVNENQAFHVGSGSVQKTW